MSNCLQCETPVLRKRYNKFCDKSCAAKFNTKKRPPRSAESREKTANSVRKFNFENAHLKITKRSPNRTLMDKICEECSKKFQIASNVKNQKFCSLSCSGSRQRSKIFRPDCLRCGATVSSYRKIFCSVACSASARQEASILRILAGHVADRKMLKVYYIAERGHRCEICFITEWTGTATPLELDHIDGNAGNNLPSNLRLICPNCHAKQPTSKGRNRGKGRGSRGIKLG